MKKHILLALACFIVLSLASCDPKKKSEGGEGSVPQTEGGESVETEEPEPVAVYYEESYDVIDSDVIDPNDEEAYRMYGVHDDEETDSPGGTPSDVDILDLPITETLQIDVLLDDFDNLNSSLRTLYRDPSANATRIQAGHDRAVRITEKIDEGSTHMTQTQLDRYEQIVNEFLSIIGQ